MSQKRTQYETASLHQRRCFLKNLQLFHYYVVPSDPETYQFTPHEVYPRHMEPFNIRKSHPSTQYLTAIANQRIYIVIDAETTTQPSFEAMDTHCLWMNAKGRIAITWIDLKASEPSLQIKFASYRDIFAIDAFEMNRLNCQLEIAISKSFGNTKRVVWVQEMLDNLNMQADQEFLLRELTL